MKNRNMKPGLWGLMIFSFTVLNGQDPQFSQFYNSSIYYNPATAGITRDLRFLSTYRNLWSKIPGDLSTYYLSVDYQWSKKNIGIGFLMLNDNGGYHRIRTNRIELVYSYRVIQEKNKLLQLGMSVFSVNFRNLQNRDFIFADQLDPIRGVVRQSSFINDELEQVIYPDWNAGVAYRQNYFWKHYKMTPTIGFSVCHILRPNISFVNNIVRLPVKFVVNANLLTQFILDNDKAPAKSKIVLVNPGFVYEYQKPFQTFSIGSGFNMEPFRVGLWFRNRSLFSDDVYRFNSVVINAGFVLPFSPDHDLIIDYTYDSTVSKLEFASGGAHEITLIYNISLPEKRGPVDCYYEWWKEIRRKLHYFLKR